MRYSLKIALGVVAAILLFGMLCNTADAGGRVHARGHVHVGAGVYFGPYYGPYYDPWYDPWYPRGYYYPPPDHGWLWTQIEPNTAEVWVDGKYFGLVKEFDGPVNHLRLPTGEHEARFRHPDYEDFTADFYIYPGETTSINFDMRPLPSGEPGRGAEAGSGTETGYGALLMEVSPGGADVYVDGEYKSTSTSEDLEMVISVPAGTRQIRVSKQGYIDYLTEAYIRPGGKTRLGVRLKEEQDDITR